MSGFRPMLGASVKDITTLRYPLFASYKLDGIRAIWYGKEFLSRTLKTLPNRQIQQTFSDIGLPSGWDGELICGEPNSPNVYRNTNSCVMSAYGDWPGSVRFFVFDNCEASGEFGKRFDTLHDILPHVVRLDQTLVSSPEELLDLENQALASGYEGLVLRAPNGLYKHGRSTLRESYLLKLKRFTDAEAEVIGFEELMHNANEPERNELGLTKRSSHQENKHPMGVLGALVCQTMEGVTFRIGTGFTQADRAAIWGHRDNYINKLAKFKYLPVGIKTAPRHPVWLGWREEIDL